MSPTIGPAVPTDLPAILDLIDRSKLPSAGLEEHVGSTLVARDGDRIVGTAALELYGGSALLRSVAVAGELRGQGVGPAPTNAALAPAKRPGVRTVYLLPQTAPPFFPQF